ncbi:hypothetical protein N7G274_002866 [Stereocaulon virgatum]|uniref:Protein kinase domain-containing protein n=1 Tax=Stereocaulon virgatum TaxID=373712 RepID=A0ABR4AH53_9LECA
MPWIRTFDGLFYAPSGLYSASLQDAQSLHPLPGRQPSSPQSRARLVKKIGEGAQGECFLMESPSTGQRFVLKRGSRRTMPFMKNQPLEALILNQVLGRHKRLINLIDWELVPASFDADSQVIMMYNYYAGGDLAKVVPERGGSLSEKFLWHIFLQLADGLSWLHYGVDSTNPDDKPPSGWHQVIHRDVKPANVFLSKHPSQNNPYPSVVLGDFGLATFEPITTSTGDRRYAAPEGENEAKSDVYALGATIYELAHGQRLGTSKPQCIHKNYSGRLNKIMMDCLLTCPKKRVSSRGLAVYLREKSPLT